MPSLFPPPFCSLTHLVPRFLVSPAGKHSQFRGNVALPSIIPSSGQAIATSNNNVKPAISVAVGERGLQVKRREDLIKKTKRYATNTRTIMVINIHRYSVTTMTSSVHQAKRAMRLEPGRLHQQVLVGLPAPFRASSSIAPSSTATTPPLGHTRR